MLSQSTTYIKTQNDFYSMKMIWIHPNKRINENTMELSHIFISISFLHLKRKTAQYSFVAFGPILKYPQSTVVFRIFFTLHRSFKWMSMAWYLQQLFYLRKIPKAWPVESSWELMLRISGLVNWKIYICGEVADDHFCEKI